MDRLICVPQTGPGNEIGAGRDRSGGVELQHRQLVYDGQQIGGPVGVQQLGAYGNPASLVAGEPARFHGHKGSSASGQEVEHALSE